MERNKDRRAQVSVFVIVAIVIVAIIVLFFVFRDRIFGDGISEEFRPVYNLYSKCIEENTKNGLSILGTQGGKIDTGLYFPGSDYAPFSSHLNFVGISIPYWLYFSGNNVIREQVPSKTDMENELNEFLELSLGNCDFSDFYSQGFFIEFEESEVKTNINDNKVDVNVKAEIVVFKEDRSARKENHKVSVESKLGKFYEIAREIYDEEKNKAFLEEYAVDVLRLNAPVDGVEVQCNPEIWKTRDVVDGLKKSLEDNIRAIKFNGRANDYFAVDLNADEPVNLLYFSDWPSKIEITPANEELMIAEPIGDEGGLGSVGFCYVPYHFVYDVSFPVLVQITNGFEIFQFPVVVVLDNNVPREAEFSELAEAEEIDVCRFRESDVLVKTYDINLLPVEADISYKCFDSVCSVGETQISGNSAALETKLPSCLNGVLIAKKDGYVEKKQVFSSNSENFAEIILDREFEINLDLKAGGKELQGFAVIHFVGDDGYARSVAFPEVKKVKLKEGNYQITVYVYGNSNIVIPGTTRKQCVETSRGLLGIFGATKEECFNVEIPETRIDTALVGGGRATTYILESELSKGNLILNAGELPKINSLEQLQYNHEAFNSLGVTLDFR